MWINVQDEPIPTYGKHAELFKLRLNFKNYYGHYPDRMREDVICMWDSVNEAFYELQTCNEVDDRDIAYWWKEDI